MSWAPLAGRRIVLGVSGSIGAVMAPALAARLRALGAEVQPVLSPAAARLVGPAAFVDACGNAPVTRLTGEGEHVRELLPDGADLLLLAPTTANTLGQVASGLDTTALTTYASVLLGHVPVLVAPAMHDTMWANPAVRANLERLRAMPGVHLVLPKAEEGSAKLADLADIDAHVLRALGPGTLAGKRVLVVAGPTAEPLEEGLWLSNRSTGTTGILLASEAFRLGAEVTMWLGATAAHPPPGCAVGRFTTVQELSAMARAPEVAEAFDAVLVPAAVGDYAAGGPRDPKTGEVPLQPTPKVVDALRAGGFTGPLVAFKAEQGIAEAELAARAGRLRDRVDALVVVANLLDKVGAEATEALLVGRGGAAEPFHGTKRALAEAVLNRVAAALR